MLRPVPSLLAAALLATAALAGCGSGDDGSDRAAATTTAPSPGGDAAQAFRLAVADGKTTIGSIGTDVETALKGAAQQSDAQLAQQFSALAGRTQAALQTLQAVTPPPDAADELTALRTAVQTGAADLQAIATAADHGDAEAAKSATRALIADSPAIGDAGDKLAAVAGVTGADTGTDGGSGKITVQYATPRGNTEKLAQQLLQVGGTDGVAAGFSQRFILPVDLHIQAVRGFVGPNYDPSTKTVTLSYGFVDYIASVIRRNDPKITDRDLGEQIAAIDGFILVHELGHAFADVLQLPLTGREEDSVDQLATVFLVGSVNNGATYAIQAARFFRLLFKDQEALKETHYWDEHSLSIQRAYDIACLVAGSSQANFDGVQKLGILPSARLERCPSEWTKIDNAWQTLLKPHLRGS